MEIVSSLVTLLSAGAAAALKESSGQAVKDIYSAIKTYLGGKLKSLGALEENPTATQQRETTEAEVVEKNLVEDKGFVELVSQLKLALDTESASSLADLGINIVEIKAAGSVVIKSVDSDAGLNISNIEASGGDVHIEGLGAGSAKKK